MERINKFLDSRQKKHVKTVKYKDEKLLITKEDLKKVRAYKSSKCLDPSIKHIPNRLNINSNEILEPLPSKVKKDYSDVSNRRLKEYYMNNPHQKTIQSDKNEIVDIWIDDDIEALQQYTQEWVYSINTPYEGKIEDLKFTKDYLDEELRNVYLKQFRPRDPKLKSIKDILPKLPDLESMRPYPELPSFEWSIIDNMTCPTRTVLFGSKVCVVYKNRIIMRDLKFNKTLIDTSIDTEIIRIAYDEVLIVSDRNSIFTIEDNVPKKIIESSSLIKDVYIDQSMIAYLTAKSIHIYDSKTYNEIKILKLKGDTPHSIKIANDTVYASTHKGIMVDSVEKSEIKNLGYVIDFEIFDKRLYAINNVNRLMIVDKEMNVVGNTVQNHIGSEIRIHRKYNLIAVLFSDEIGIYKIAGEQCIPINTISGMYKSVGWDEDMPWLYCVNKKKVVLFT